MQEGFGIHWFRRDLRISGNQALRYNFEKNRGRVLGLFCFDSKFLGRDDFSHNRFAFFLETLSELRKELQACGGDLLVIDCEPETAFQEIFKFAKTPPNLLTFCRDYEPYARARDKKIESLFSKWDVEVFTARDHVVVEPDEILKNEGGFYQVYSPFGKKWYEQMAVEKFRERISRKTVGLKFIENSISGEWPEIFNLKWKQILKPNFPFPESLEVFKKRNLKSVTIEIPSAGTVTAYKQLQKFKKKLEKYKTARDFPGEEGTSRLSLFFKNGSLTTSQAIAFLGLGNETFGSESGQNRFLKEIVWREFYYSILWNCPRVEKEAFLEKYKDLKWGNNKAWFKRWCEGTTGYPIVDAGMRQLNTTGWMHNRVRMIVASFLTKDLLIDWRWGENYFMKMLLDGDLASNNGGWQWAASTGCDPQPYFRIFNPYLQSEKFDPNGDYIRQYVPELRSLKGKSIHKPEGVAGYPKPLVDHSVQRDLALRIFTLHGKK